MPNPAFLKATRQIHHYLGVFIAPAVLFFSFTGFLQTFSFHETTRGSSYVPPAIFVHLGQLHKKATLTVPQRKPAPPPDSKPDARPPRLPDQPAKTAPPAPPQAPQPTHLPMKLFFGLVAIGLFTSTFTGLYMAWKYNSRKLLITAVFLAGIVIPLLLLPL